MEYDEIRITTRREINICRGAIKTLEATITSLEEKYRLTAPGSLEGISGTCMSSPIVADEDQRRWRESHLALERWKERLKAHQQIMEL